MTRPCLLLVGPLNAPHFLLWAQEVAERGYEVHMCGELAPTWPDAEAPAGVASYEPMPELGPPGLRAARLVPWLRRLIERVRPDVTHAHWLPSFGWIAARAGARPLVASAWGSDVYRAGFFVARRSRFAAETADLVLCDSADLAEAVRELCRREPRIELAGWGVDLDAFSPPGPGGRAQLKRRLGLGEGPVVLSTRSLVPLYNVTVIVAAFAAVRERVPGAQLVLKHPRVDELPADVAEALRSHGVEDATRVVGNVPASELADWYRAADVAVSIPATDSSPRTVWEGLACGTPTIVSDLPWAREAFEPERDALLVPAEPGPLGEALLRVLEDRELAERLSEGGRRLAAERMDRRREFERVDELYRSLIA
jgi:glycosyltransferase involved in cell wall biosynthesis